MDSVEEKISIFVGFSGKNSDGFALNRLENQTGVDSAKLVDMNSLVRRKQVDSVHLIKNDGPHQLAKKLSAVDLVAIGMRKLQALANFDQNSLWVLIVFLSVLICQELGQQLEQECIFLWER